MDKKLTISSTDFQDLYVIEDNSFKDERGFFSRVYCCEELSEITQMKISQINHSYTREKGTVRGFHFQYEPDSEIKIVKCIRGSIMDIVVDIRKDSPTFLQHFSIELTQENQKMLFIPKGFAHGFQTLSSDTELIYLHSNMYNPFNEGGLNIKDPLLNISFPLEITNISHKDSEHSFLDSNFQGLVINEM